MNNIDYKQVLQQLPHIYYVIDIDNYTIIDSNSEEVVKGKDVCYNRIFGYDTPCFNFNDIECACHKLKENNKKFEAIQNFNVNGVKKIFKVKANPILDSDKKRNYVIVQYMDVTNEFELQDELKEQNVKLQAQNEEYLTVNEELKQANKNIEKAKAEISNLKEFFETINESVHDGIWVTDKDDMIFYTNPGMEKIAGIARVEIINKNVLKDFPKETVKELLPFFNKAKENLKPVQYQINVFTPAKRNTIQSGWLTPLVRRGLYNGMICTVRDVTESVHFNTRIANSEEKFRMLFENMLEAFALHEIITDENNVPVDYKFVDVNPGFEKLTGLKRTDVIGNTVLELLPKTEKVWIEKYGEVALTGKGIHFENYSQELNKYFRVIAFSTKPGFFAVLFEDITAFKQAEKDLKESMDKFNQFIDESIDALSLVSSEGDILIWNKAQEKLTGYSFKEVRNKKVWDVHMMITTEEFRAKLSPEQTKQNLKEIHKSIKKGWDKRVEIPIQRKNGEIRYVEQVLFPVETANGILLGGINRDITEIREANLKLKQSEERYRRLTENSPEITYIYSLKGGARYWSARVKDILGIDPKDLKTGSRKWTESILPKYRKEIEHLFKTIKPGGTYILEYEIYDSKGNIHWFNDHIFNVYEEDKDIILEGIVKDITEDKETELALKQSEERYRTLIESSYDMIFVMREGKVVFANNKIFEKSGYNESEIIGQSFIKFLEKTESEKIIKLYEDRVNGKSVPGKYQSKVLTKSGDIVDVEITVVQIEFEGEKAQQVVMTDISTRVIAERKIKESEEKFRSVLENIQLVSVMLDTKGNITFANDYLLELTGWKRNEVIGKDWFKTFLPQNVRKQVREFFNDSLKKGSMNVSYINEIITKNNEERIVSWNNTFQYDNDNNIISLTSIGEDITDKKKTEEELKEAYKDSKFWFDIVYDSSVAVAIGYPDGRLGLSNPAFNELIGYTDEEIRVLDWNEVLTPEKWKKSEQEALNKLHKTGLPVTYEKEYIRKDGTIVPIELIVHGVTNDNGIIDHYRVFITDISERKKTENELIKANETLKITNKIAKLGYWSYDLNTKIPNWSNEMFTIFGLKVSNGAPNYDQHKKSIHPDDWNLFDGAVKDCVDKGKSYDLILRIIHPDKSIRYIKTIGLSRLDNEGKVIELFGTTQDITQRIISEQELKKQRDLFELVINSATTRIFWKDLNSVYMGCNTQFVADAGMGSIDDVIGSTDYDMVWKDNAEKYRSDDQEVIQSGKAKLAYEEELVGTNGELIIWQTNKMPLKNEQGDIIGVLATSENITEKEIANKEIKKNEALLQKVFDILPIGLWFADKNGKLIKGNPKGKEIWGAEPLVSPEDYGVFKARTLPSREEIKPEDWALVHTITKGETIKDELLEIDAFDGVTRTILNYTTPVFDEDGKIDKAVIVNLDISDLQNTQNKLKRSEEQFRKVYENMKIGLAFVSLDFTIQRANDAYCNMLGYKETEIIGKHLKDITSKEDIEENLIKQRKLAKGEIDHFRMEKEFVHKNGNSVYGILDANLIRNESGDPVYFIGSILDITEKKYAEDELKESEERYNLAVHASTDGIFDWNLITNEIYYSPVWKSMLGYKDNELENDFSVWEKLTAPDDVKESWDRLKKHIAGETDRFEMEFKMKHKNGHWVDILSRANAYFNHEGVAYRMVGTHTDITERKKSEQTLLNAKEEIENNQKLLNTVAENYPNSFISIIEKDLTIGFSSGQEFKNQNLNPADFLGLTLKQVFGEHEEFVKKQYLKTFKGEEIKFEIYINNQYQLYKTVPLYNEKNMIDRIMVVVENITERRLAEVALKESEDRYRHLVETASDAIYLMDEGGNVVDCNQCACDILKFSKEELLKLDIGKIDTNFPLKDFVEFWRNTPFNEQQIFETTHKRKDGTLVPVEVSGKKFKYENKIYYYGVARDLSERKKQEKVLLESESKFRSYLNNAPYGIFVADEKGKYIEVNPKSCEITGYTEEELLKLHVPDLILERDLANAQKHFEACIKNGFSTGELAFKTKNGEERYWRVDAVKLSETRMLGFVTDTTEAQLARNALLESEEKFKTLTESSPLAVMLFQDNKWIYVNPKAIEITEYSESELLKMNFWDIVHPDYAELVKQRGGKRQKGKDAPYNYDFKIVTKNGNEKWVSLYGASTTYAGKPAAILSVLDISELKTVELALKDSERKLRNITENSTNMFYQHDVEGNLSYVSPQVENIIGYTVDEAMAHWTDFISDNSLNREAIKSTQKAIETGEVQPVYELELLHKNGKRVWVEVREAPLVEKGKTIAIVGALSDITEQRKASVALEQSEKLYRKLFESANAGIGISTISGDILAANQAMSKIFKYSNKELLQKGIKALYKDLKDRDILLGKVKKGGVATNMQFQMKPKNGKDLWVHLSAQKINIVDDDRLLFVISDVTKEKQAELELKEQEARFRAYIETSPIAIFIVNEKGEYEYANKSVTSMLGYTQKEILNMSIPDIKIVNKEQNVYDDFNKLKKDGSLASQEVVYKTKKGKLINGIVDAVKLSDGEYIAFCTDVSMLKAYEKNLKEKNEEYQALNEELHEYIAKIQKINIELIEAKKQAEESDRLKSAFLANMSHELRTPLNGILGFSTLMQKANLQKESLVRYSQIIETSGKRLLTVVNDLFDISLIHSDQLKVEKELFKINELLDEIHTFYHTIKKEKIKQVGLKLIKASESEITISNDKYRLHQVFKNLLDNAFKFTESGEITFGYTLDTKNKIRFYVKDTGIGIEKKFQEIIFSSFKQVDDSITRDYEGAGLGLSICSGLLERMGGKIWVESQKGEGSQFYFELPLKTEMDNTDSEEDTKGGKNLLKNKIILIVEDDLVSYEFLKIYLENIGGSGIIQTSNGEDAVKIAASTKVDLIFMDIRLPGIDGYETTKRIRELNKNVKIIAQTAYALENDDQKSIAAGCDYHISKPINETDLLKIIQEYFG